MTSKWDTLSIRGKGQLTACPKLTPAWPSVALTDGAMRSPLLIERYMVTRQFLKGKGCGSNCFHVSSKTVSASKPLFNGRKQNQLKQSTCI